MQKNNKEKVWKHVLHLFKDGSFWFQLPHRASLGKGGTWSISEVRSEGSETTVLHMQYTQRRNGSRLLQKNVKRKRSGIHGQTRKRQA